jgi:tetratricopeptide (TPR) repeat protein
MIHEKLRAIECARSWRTALIASEAVLKKRWSPVAWACQVFCFDTLGDFRGIQRSAERYESQIERSSIEVRGYRLYIVGRMHQALGEYDIAAAAYMRALALGPSREIHALTMLQTSTINVFLGSHAEALSNLTTVRDEALRRRDWISAAHALDFLADRAIRLGEIAKARAHLASARKYAQRSGNLYRLDWITALEGQVLFEEGRQEEGLRQLRAARDSFAATGARGSEMQTCLRLSDHLVKLKRAREAEKEIERGLALGTAFRYNVNRIALLRLNATVKRRLGKLKAEAFSSAMKRADILTARNQKSWSSARGRGQIYSVADVGAFLATLDPYLFEVVCKQVLEADGYDCELTPQNEPFIDIIARRKGEPLTWGVSCKRVRTTAGIKEMPGGEAHLITLGVNAFSVMTTVRISGQAARHLTTLRGLGIKVDTWEGTRLCEFLAAHDWILADVGTQLPATSPR